jgi:hypothetical protein
MLPLMTSHTDVPPSPRRTRRALLSILLALACLGATAAPALAVGEFPMTFQNNTDGHWADREIHITGLGQTAPGQWAYLKPDGTMAPLDHTMAGRPGHLTKDGRNYPNMSFTLADAATVRIPAHVQGGRIYVSVGAPMYIGVSPDDRGWAGPDLDNPDDPNHDTTFDWYEFTYQYGAIPFGGNTTQVDQFAIPMTARLEQRSTGYDRKLGIEISRKQVYERFRKYAGSAFDGLASAHRILAPRSAPAFSRGGVHAGYLEPAIDKAWKEFRDGFRLTRLNQTFTGRTTGDTLTFRQEGVDGRFEIDKPTTQDVMRCSGALAKPGMKPQEGVMGAELCAALNRAVGDEPRDWYRPAAYYRDANRGNDYAGFFHSVSLDDRSYAFAYDDVNDQSSVAILPNADPPSRVIIGIGW